MKKKAKKAKKKLTGQVRPARLSDIPSIYKVIRENPKEVLPRSYPDLSRNFDRFLVYEDKGRIKGVISWQVLPNIDLNEESTLEIVSLSVRKRYQKQGIGRMLVNKMIRKLEKFEPDRILVLTYYPRFFKKFGFKRVSKRRLYPKIYAGCINCTKYLSPLACPEKAMVRIVKRKQTEVSE